MDAKESMSVSVNGYEVELSVNDRNVPLNDFAERMIARTICGMVSALKKAPGGEGDADKIEIVIKRSEV